MLVPESQLEENPYPCMAVLHLGSRDRMLSKYPYVSCFRVGTELSEPSRFSRSGPAIKCTYLLQKEHHGLVIEAGHFSVIRGEVDMTSELPEEFHNHLLSRAIAAMNASQKH